MYYAVKVDEPKCNGCKLCIFGCPDPNVLVFLEPTKKVAVVEARCKGCGLCVWACPKDALSVRAA